MPLPINDILEFIKKPEISAALLTAFFAIIARLIQPKAKIYWGASHQFAFNIPQNNGAPILIYTRTVSIRNYGRAHAKDVEVYFGYKPEHFQIWPITNYTSATNPEGHFIIHMDNIAKKEHLSIELIQSYREPPILFRIKTMDGECKQVLMAPQLVVHKWLVALIWALILLGSYKVIEWVIRLLQ